MVLRNGVMNQTHFPQSASQFVFTELKALEVQSNSPPSEQNGGNGPLSVHMLPD